MRERPIGDDGQHDLGRELDALGNYAQEQVVVLPRVRVPAAVVDDVDHVVVESRVLVAFVYLVIEIFSPQHLDGGAGAKQG